MSHRFHGVCASVLLAAALSAQGPGAPTFDSNARLVLVPFNVERGRYFATDLRPSDFILHEDGHPRDFTVFEGPHTANPLPLELILLFDTTVIPPHPERILGNWDPKSDYEFLSNWDESITREVLQRNGMDIRVAIYHFAGKQLERLCGATSDPREVVNAFHSLLNPIPQARDELTLLSGHKVGKPLFGPPVLGWLDEATVAALEDSAASPEAARRVLLVFTSGGGETGRWKDTYGGIVDPALALNIPVVPVIMDFSKFGGRIIAAAPGPGRGTPSTDGIAKGAADNLGEVRSTDAYTNLPWFASVGEKTGGEAFFPPHLDRETLASILAVVRNTVLSRYVVGFTPDAAAKPKKHVLAVKLTSKSKGKLVGGEKNGVVY